MYLKTENFLSDVGGLGTFATIFGTLYGIMSAFVVFEVWAQFNKLSILVDKEALGVEKLFRLTIYLLDKKVSKDIKEAIRKYAKIIIEGKFKTLGGGYRNPKTSRAFREIFKVIKNIKFDSKRDEIIFNRIVEQYEQVHEIRTERINQSLIRLPILLKAFLYLSSAIVILTFVIMPFSNINYGFFAIGTLGLIIAMLIQIIEDLDNPFLGHWNITPEPFERSLKHIEEDY